MNTKIIRQRAKIIKWQGVNKPDITMGFIIVERRFKVFKDGHMRLDESFSERLLSVNGRPINCRWNMTTLEEFFPGFSGYEVVGEI